MVKSGLEKYFWNSSMRKSFSDLQIYFIKGEFLPQITKFRNKNYLVCARRDFNSTSCVLSRYSKRPVRTEKSSISGVLGVQALFLVIFQMRFSILDHCDLTQIRIVAMCAKRHDDDWSSITAIDRSVELSNAKTWNQNKEKIP